MTKKSFLTIILALSASVCVLGANDKSKDKNKKEEPAAEAAPPRPVLDAVAHDKLNMAKNMLDRVEKIVLIDTIHVDSLDFISSYKLSVDCGEFSDGSSLPPELSDVNPNIVYRTQNGKELFWAQKADSALVIYTADVLDNGLVDNARPLGDAFSDGGGDSDYPFVLQDGLTVYFANNGDNSLGGYDIFMTRRSPEGDVLQPQNIGMPFNSPYNDYMMVIDETRNLGWWVSDREHIPGKLTVYVFQPQEMRQNYSPDSPNIEDLALLIGVKPEGDLQSRLVDDIHYQTPVDNDFDLIIKGKRVTSINQLHNAQAREAAEQLIGKLTELRRDNDRLELLRSQYASGKKNVANEILSLEKRQLQLPVEIQRLGNKVISLESGSSRR